MKDFNRLLTRENIFNLLHFSGLTDEQFANVLGISIRWLRYIKSGKYDFKIDEIETAAKFFNQPFAVLTTKRISIPRNLRDILLITYKKNQEYAKVLSDNPTIPYAIEFLLIDHPNFQDKKMEIKEIRGIFSSKGWLFKGSSISNALKQMNKTIHTEPHPTKKGTNVYSKKR